jgi:hypothetical protein
MSVNKRRKAKANIKDPPQKEPHHSITRLGFQPKIKTKRLAATKWPTTFSTRRHLNTAANLFSKNKTSTA